MSRERREIQDLLARLGSQVSPPSEHDLRTMARTASSRSRPLPSPVPSRRWPLQARWTGVLVIALVVAIGLGVGLGALIAPSGTAAPGPIGTGFLPGPGWTVLQTGSDATPERQALAVAANVPLHQEDSARGIRNSSGLPYSTLLQLPPRGVVIVALFTRREWESGFWADLNFPERELPLRFRDATNSGYQMRPQRPLGQYELRAMVGGHNIVLHFYFGTAAPPPQLIATAQRQLDRLIVASASAITVGAQTETSSTDSAFSSERTRLLRPGESKIVDRTYVCITGNGNPREIDVSANAGIRLPGDRSKWEQKPRAGFVAELTWTPTMQSDVSATISAGWPPPKYVGVPLATESLWISTRCRASRAAVPLSTAGLKSVVVGQFGEAYDCNVPATILVRARSVFRAPTSIRRLRRGVGNGTDFVARGPVREGMLAIRTPLGKSIALATVHESGRARLFIGSTCGANG